MIESARLADIRWHARRSAFSLVELMVVIVIMGLLAGVATISVRTYLIRGKQNVARLEISKICQAIDTFYGQFDRYPTPDEGIAILATKSDAFPDGLLSKPPIDPWGHPYEYLVPGRSGPYEVICYGADHREGGSGADADISSSDLGQDRSKSNAQ
ncbi:MAG TPA: type II secretion system major pseudopilin GspG [Planctomycetaceae bacterium]|nr:type II secretion system major pseudopilin GspG [Planctomycetaceae bacterium]